MMRTAFCCVTLGLVTLTICAAMVNAQGANAIKSIRSAPSLVEIEVYSPEGFPVRDALTVLQIGSLEVVRNRPPDDGSLNSLIFMLTAEEFARVNTGDPVTVRYGREEHGRRYDFGRLDKGRVTR